MNAEVIVARLKEAWQEWEEGTQPGLLPGFGRIAGSPEDQLVPPGISNPYWEIIRWMPVEQDHDSGMLAPTYPQIPFTPHAGDDLTHLGVFRKPMVRHYTWSIITPGDVAWMVDQLGGRGVVEIGAGTGYWAWQLRQAGVDVVAYDPHVPGTDNPYCTGGPYTAVRAGDATAVADHQDRALLMVWPSRKTAHTYAGQALSLYEGDLLIYAGQGPEGATADNDFFALLDKEWEQISISPHHRVWWGVQCQLTAYTRKAVTT